MMLYLITEKITFQYSQILMICTSMWTKELNLQQWTCPRIHLSMRNSHYNGCSVLKHGKNIAIIAIPELDTILIENNYSDVSAQEIKRSCIWHKHLPFSWTEPNLFECTSFHLVFYLGFIRCVGKCFSSQTDGVVVALNRANITQNKKNNKKGPARTVIQVSKSPT